MNAPQTPLTQNAKVHMNLKSVATVATPATALRRMACSRCHPIKKVATTGNTHLRFNIWALSYCNLWLSLLPLKIRWQQNHQIGNDWRPRKTGLLPMLPLLPVFFDSQEHVLVKKPGWVVL